jgi:taurine dioxygenase
MRDENIKVKLIAGALGAEISGVDLSSELSNQVREQIHQAFLDYLMIYFPDQSLSAAQQVKVAAMFGKPAVYPYLAGVEGVPEAHELIKTADDPVNFGGIWHSDTTYKPEPDMGTVLYACEVPDAGGDTLFSNAYLAFDALSDGMKAMLDGLVAVNDSEKLYPGGRAKRISNLSEMKGAYNDGSDAMQSEHPVVRTHPQTGRKSLYVNTAHTLCFKGMTVEESKPLIDFLSDHCVRPEYTCRLRWQDGTVAIWDNRCTQHFAVNDYPNAYRRMRRVTIEGDRPH